MSKVDALAAVRRWYLEEQRGKRGSSEALRASEAMDDADWSNDSQFLAWANVTGRSEEALKQLVAGLKAQALALQLKGVVDAGAAADGFAKALSGILQSLPADARKDLAGKIGSVISNLS
eukprot:TRINITY_DN12799_c0_g3_i1.p2 TRINITY_DN12799_c0_g3~~TRINITY_DN12799_c0_g3_i1.p2  ORF type:complete len:133 (-),score=17.76 TRINITY_DN12799_c0_g3_i1:544-903(-)